MTSSGTYGFQLPEVSSTIEAFDRIGILPLQITTHQMLSARTSQNLLFIEWENEGFPAWKVTSGTINLVAGTGTYSLPTNLVMLTELWYSTVNGGGAGINSDRIMFPITRSQWAQIVNKNQTGTPTQYWFEMTATPRINIWQAPAVGAPSYVLNWYGIQQMQDATMTGSESPDVVRRAFDALCAGMAYRLCEKFGPKDPQAKQAMMAEKKSLYDDAKNAMYRRDQEPGPMILQPNVSPYTRLGRR